MSSTLKSRLKKTNENLGREYYNSKMSLTYGIQRKYEMAKIRRRTPSEGDSGKSKVLDPPRHVFRIGNVYDSELINSIRTKCEEAVERGENCLINEYKGEVYQERLASSKDPSFDFQKHIPEVEDVLNEEVIKIVRRYYQQCWGTSFYPDFVEFRRNYHIPDEVVSESDIFSNYWHIDGPHRDYLRLFINLNNVTEDRGPFHVISREETKQLYSSEYHRDEEGLPNHKVESEADIIKAIGEPGTATLAGTSWNLHRAGIPEPGEKRDVLMIMFRATSKPFESDWLETYPLTGEWIKK